MSGNRCVFRDCKVNITDYPFMRFFRFPMTDAERYRKWRHYSKQESMLAQPLQKKKNFVICLRHFRDECFVDYRKECLTPAAVPTLHRLSKDKALDYEQDIENGVLVTLSKPKQKHLIPPADFVCPLQLGIGEGEDIDDRAHLTEEMYVREENQSIPYKRIFEGETDDSDVVDPLRMTQSNESKSSCNTNKRLKKYSETTESEEVPGSSIVDRNITHSDSIISIKQEATLYEENQVPTIITNENLRHSDSMICIKQETLSCSSNDAGYESMEITLKEVPAEKVCNESPSLLIGEGISDWDHAYTTESMEKTLKDVEVKQVYNESPSLLIGESISDWNHANSTEEELQEDISQKDKQQHRSLQSQIISLTNENLVLKQRLRLEQQLSSVEIERRIKLKYEQKLKTEKTKHAVDKAKLLREISILQQNLDESKQQQSADKVNYNLIRKIYSNTLKEKADLLQQRIEINQELQNLQEKLNDINKEHRLLKKHHEILKSNYDELKESTAKCGKCTATTSIAKSGNTAMIKKTKSKTLEVNPSTKMEVFNSIKRYINASMIALLRMDMFGSPDRAWKDDEQQVSIEILRLGEIVYIHFIDVWHLRLPALPLVKNWLEQENIKMEEKDL